jgi:lipopolysaccharide transport system permease protein
MINRGLSEPEPRVRIYTPESPIRRPLRFLAESAAEARAARMLAWRLVVRDIAAQYRQTAFGYVWAVLPAVITTLVWVLLNASKFVSIETGDIPYPVYVLTGTIFWQFFLDSLNAPLKQLGGNRSMLNRVNFPSEALLMSGMVQVLFSLLIKLVVLAVVMAVYRVPVHWTAVLIVVPIAAILAIGTVVGVLIAPVGVLYRDVEQMLLLIVMPLMFLTPVVYPPPGGAIGRIMHLNPLTPIFEVTRALLFGGVGPYVVEFTVVFLMTLFIAILGWVVFRLALPVLIERLEA